MDSLLLSRLQFALTIGFHYIFPPLSIGLGLLLVFMEGAYLRTKKPLYERMTQFWVKIFGLIFALGVATGIVMEFQFGTNWSVYSRFVGDVFGSALAAEGIFAFFLESGFLAILIFGWNKVKPRTHFIATLLVCIGAHFSAIWIVVANSWQQTPAGHHIVEAANGIRAEIVNFWEMVFNPSSLDRISHVYMGAWQAGAFFVLSVSAFYLLKKKHVDFAKASIKMALILAAIASILQLVTGHQSAIGVSKNQPTKLAAMEALYAGNEPADMYLFGWVNEKEERVSFGIRLKGLLSFLIHGNTTTPVKGLNSFPPDQRPPVNIVFQSYHLMVAIGVLLILISWMGLALWIRKKLFDHRWLLWVFIFAVLGPMIANQIGWITAEVGRQPFIVYDILKTSDAFSPGVTPQQILTSLILFSLIYILLFILFIYLLNDKIVHGPEELKKELDQEPLWEGHRA